MQSEMLSRTYSFAEILKNVSDVSLTHFSADFDVIFTTADNVRVLSDFFAASFSGELPENVSEISIPWNLEDDTPAPSVFTNALGMTWLSDATAEKGKITDIFTLGPVFLNEFSVSEIERSLDKLKLSVAIKHQFISYIRSLPIIPLNRFYEYGVMLHYSITGQKSSVSDFSFPLEARTKDQDEPMRNAANFLAEKKILQLVEEGNLSYKEVFDRYMRLGQPGFHGGPSLFRQQKNTVIMFITLCSRAAIRGGLSAEAAYDLCDYYIAEVEHTINIEALAMLSHKMYDDFIHRVYRCRAVSTTTSAATRKAMEYITLHPEENLDVKKLSKMTGYTDYYFSTKFKQETGRSVRDFVTEVKIERAKVLLKNPQYTIKDVAEELGFSSQSHFGDVFKKATGMTPGAFKEGI